MIKDVPDVTPTSPTPQPNSEGTPPLEGAEGMPSEQQGQPEARGEMTIQDSKFLNGDLKSYCINESEDWKLKYGEVKVSITENKKG